MTGVPQVKVVILLLCLLHHVTSLGVIRISEDVQGVSGDLAVLSCTASGSTSTSCSWIGPAGDDVYDPGEHGRLNVTATYTESELTCTLYIDSLDGSDAGAWYCSYEDGRLLESRGKYLFISLVSGERIIRPTEPIRIQEERNGTLTCPTTIRPVNRQQRPLCTWISPKNKRINIVGRNGEIFEYPEYSQFGNIDRGVCGIMIKKISPDDSGTWSCRIISKLTSKILEESLEVRVVESSGAFSLPALPSPESRTSEATFADTFILPLKSVIKSVRWIVRREIQLGPGKQICREGLISCIKSSELESGMTDFNSRLREYNVNITFFGFSEEDRRSPLALVVKFVNPAGLTKYLNRMISTSRDGSNNSNLTPAPLFPSEPNLTATQTEVSVASTSVTPATLSNAELQNGNITLNIIDRESNYADIDPCPQTSCWVQNFKLENGERKALRNYCTMFRCVNGKVKLRKLKNCSFETGDDGSKIYFPRNN